VPGVAVITDSTADIPRGIAEERGLRVVPMTVTFADESYISGVTLETDRFYELLAESDELPTTSQPNPAWFEEAYADAADDGMDAVVSIHVSRELSGTYDLACKVAAEADLPVTVVDSRHAGGSLALGVFAALRAAEAGATAAEVADAADEVARDAALYFVVDDLAYLKRGGRLTGAQKVLGSMLRVKPVLTIDDGRVVPHEKVRTWSKAIARLGVLAGAYADGGEVDVIVTHAVADDRAEKVWDAVRETGDVRDHLFTTIGPVVGTHIGPGAVGVALAHRRG
jgi:DegV family protein with EDD domain